jgi:hypothetical protein
MGLDLGNNKMFFDMNSSWNSDARTSVQFSVTNCLPMIQPRGFYHGDRQESFKGTINLKIKHVSVLLLKDRHCSTLLLLKDFGAIFL